MKHKINALLTPSGAMVYAVVHDVLGAVYVATEPDTAAGVAAGWNLSETGDHHHVVPCLLVAASDYEPVNATEAPHA